ncbi:MAG TPA: serine hydrolase [Candidatus Baltobacteraceae bacterium]|nr:serine hydrolase [Candidatus Baltobacteraceae bacterium]
MDLARWAAELGIDPVSAVVKAAGAESPLAEIDPGKALYPASMIKTPLAAAAYHLIHQRALGLDDAATVDESNMTANDARSPLVPGYRARIGELIELMIARSDNVATNVLFDVLGRERATRIVQRELGLRHTAFYRKLSGDVPLIDDPGWDGVHRNTHPAADAAVLFERIALATIPGAQELRAILLRQEWNEKLPRGLRAGDRFAHKTGDTDEVTHDGGILYTGQGGAYVAVVYAGMPSTAENNAKFGPFMQRIRSALL